MISNKRVLVPSNPAPCHPITPYVCNEIIRDEISTQKQTTQKIAPSKSNIAKLRKRECAISQMKGERKLDSSLKLKVTDESLSQYPSYICRLVTGHILLLFILVLFQ